MPTFREPHKQGSNLPRAVFYFVREKPELLTGARSSELVAKYLAMAIRQSEPGRFRRFLACVEDDPQVPERERAFPKHRYPLPGLLKRVPLGVSREILDQKLHHAAEHMRRMGKPSVRAPEYHRPEHCVLYVGSFPFHLVNARYNLEETGVLKRKWMDFCIRASMLIPASEGEELRRPEEADTCIHVDCFESENFNSDSFDAFARAIGLKRRRGQVFTTDEVLDRLRSLPPELAEVLEEETRD